MKICVTENKYQENSTQTTAKAMAVMPLGLYPFGITAEAVEKVYDYDDRGNITAMHDYSYTTGTTLTSGNTYNYEYGDASWADLLTEYDGADIAYDALGNPTNWIWGEYENGDHVDPESFFKGGL